jgi:hypothetical protein
MIHHIMTMTPGVINRTRCSDGAVAVAMAVVAAMEKYKFPMFCLCFAVLSAGKIDCSRCCDLSTLAGWRARYGSHTRRQDVGVHGYSLSLFRIGWDTPTMMKCFERTLVCVVSCRINAKSDNRGYSFSCSSTVLLTSTSLRVATNDCRSGVSVLQYLPPRSIHGYIHITPALPVRRSASLLTMPMLTIPGPPVVAHGVY